MKLVTLATVVALGLASQAHAEPAIGSGIGGTTGGAAGGLGAVTSTVGTLGGALGITTAVATIGLTVANNNKDSSPSVSTTTVTR